MGERPFVLGMHSENVGPHSKDKMSFSCVLGPLHTRAKGHDHEMVRALNYHAKAIPCVLGKPFCVVTGPQT